MESSRIRLPAVAGTFYPGSVAELQKMIETYLAEATPPQLTGVRAIIAPHAGYIYSGPTAAFSYKLLKNQTTKPTRILLMGPAHRVWFRGVALADYTAFETPMGEIAVDSETIQKLLEDNDIFQPLSQAHSNEHSLEVQLPFLQKIYDAIPIVPMLFGDVDPTAVAETLNSYLEPDDIVVVSSDLSHYHSYAEAQNLDRDLIDALLRGDQIGVARGEACGQAPIVTLMTIAQQHNWHPHLLDYRNSGDTAGDRQHVVGYTAVAYTED